MPFAPVKKPVERSQIHPWTYSGPSLDYRAWITAILPLKVHRDTLSLDFRPSPQPLKRQRNTWYLDFDMLPPRVMGSTPSIVIHQFWDFSSRVFNGYSIQTSNFLNSFTTVPRLGLYIHEITNLKGGLTVWDPVIIQSLCNFNKLTGKWKELLYVSASSFLCSKISLYTSCSPSHGLLVLNESS